MAAADVLAVGRRRSVWFVTETYVAVINRSERRETLTAILRDVADREAA